MWMCMYVCVCVCGNLVRTFNALIWVANSYKMIESHVQFIEQLQTIVILCMLHFIRISVYDFFLQNFQVMTYVLRQVVNDI